MSLNFVNNTINIYFQKQEGYPAASPPQQYGPPASAPSSEYGAP